MAILNAGSKIGAGGSMYALLRVTVTGEGTDMVGGTVTATDGTNTFTATTNNNGVADVTIETPGTYEVSYAKGDLVSKVKSAFIGFAGATYTLNLTIRYAQYWAVDIAINESDPLSRCTYPQMIVVDNKTVNNECYGYTPMSSTNMGNSPSTFSAGSWNGDELIANIKPVSFNGTTWSNLDTDATSWADNNEGTDYFTEFPFYWLSITNDSTNNRIRIIFSDSDNQPDENFQCYAHCKGCDDYSNSQIESAMSSASRSTIMANNNNDYFANAFHISCFFASGTTNAIYSRKNSNVSPLKSTAYANFFKAANARGTDYDCMSFQQLTYLQALFVLLFRSTNSQASHSYGYVGQSSVQYNAGLATDTYGMYGNCDEVQGRYMRMAFFWIHDLWGNAYNLIGGAWNRKGSSSKLYYWLPRQANSRAFNNGWTAASTYATQIDMGTDSGVSGTSSTGYISAVAGTNNAGFCPIAQSNASASTYWCDWGGLVYNTSIAFFATTGGYYNDSTNAGIFYFLFTVGSTNSGSYYCTRLAYRGGHI